MNRSLNARVDWGDAGLTFFRNFPNLTLTLDDLTAVGVGRFEGDTLAAVRHLRVVLDLASVLGNVMGGQADRRARRRARPAAAALITLEDGTANWDITKKTPETAQPQAASKPMAISLKRFEINDAAVALDNRQAKLKASVLGYDQSLTRRLQPGSRRRPRRRPGRTR